MRIDRNSLLEVVTSTNMDRLWRTVYNLNLKLIINHTCNNAFKMINIKKKEKMDFKILRAEGYELV